MGEKQNRTRHDIVEAAARLFWANGYERTTLAAIQEEAGVYGGSVYHFFKTKTEIARAVVRRYRGRLEPDLIEGVVERFEHPIERIFGLLAGYRELLLVSDYSYGCPIGALALELGNQDEEVREGIVDNFEGWRDAVKVFLREDPRLSGRADLDDLARFILTVMEGAVLQARAYRDLGPFDASVAQLRLHIANLAQQDARRQSRPAEFGQGAR